MGDASGDLDSRRSFVARDRDAAAAAAAAAPSSAGRWRGNPRHSHKARPGRDAGGFERASGHWEPVRRDGSHGASRSSLVADDDGMRRSDIIDAVDLSNQMQSSEQELVDQNRRTPSFRTRRMRDSLTQESSRHVIPSNHGQLEVNPPLQDPRGLQTPPSQDFRMIANHSSQDARMEPHSSHFDASIRNTDDPRQWRGGTHASGGRGDTRQATSQQSGSRSAVYRRRPLGENSGTALQHELDAARDAVAGALQGLRLNRVRRDSEHNRAGVGSSAGENPMGGTRDFVARESWTSDRSLRKLTELVRQTDGLGTKSGAATKRTEIIAKEKRNIPQLVQELEEKLTRGSVECMICYESVKRDAAVWSCMSCYSIFHISCIRTWARAPTSADMSVTTSGQAMEGNWRCPGCQAVQFVNAEELRYKCFCGQVVEPSVDYYITPHSCGGPCRKPLGRGKNSHCKHSCTMQCHPGPCPPCTALAPPQYCPCGKTSSTRRCSEADSVRSCGQPCERQLQCGRHICVKTCHEEPCGVCDMPMAVKCFCGRKTEKILCGDMDLHGELQLERGVFSCESTCMKTLSCGNHLCLKECHSGQCGDCELSPSRVQTCPCGKKPLHELLGNGKHRKSCSDPIPLCGQVCEKLLPCGKHTCGGLCHTGPCLPCIVLVEQKCRCESTTRTVPCYKTLAIGTKEINSDDEVDCDGLFLCNRQCGKKKNCGRHRCNNRCCPLLNDGSITQRGDGDPHLCLLPCGKKLRCGQHTCQELCHNGHCSPCLESTFTELSCACGRTAIPPPVPCGTPPPSCQHPCSVPQPCGHPATHTCHFGECPPCTVPSAKECVGNHVILRNVPCGSRDIKCNKLCGKTRQCGLHACARTCHLSPCDMQSSSSDSGNAMKSCGQPCGAPRRDCKHTCTAPCHPSAPCPDARCKFPVTITCSCGRLSGEVPCDAGDLGKGNILAETAAIMKLPAPLQPVEGKEVVPLGQRKLACDDECAKLEKRRILADAFGVSSVVDSASTLEGITAGSESLSEMIKREPQWVSFVEERFKYLVLGTKAIGSGQIRVHVFCSLPKEKRDAVRQLAERWNLAVSAVGREPRRFLMVHATPKSRAPARSLIGRAPFPLAGQAHAPSFNPTVDMDPRLVVGLFDLPREADVSTLVLRFGGECELIWLNDKNALAIFADAARANTALRRVDHASAYHGATAMPQHPSGTASRGWGSSEGASSTKNVSRRKSTQESSWVEDAWGENTGRVSEISKSVWHGKGGAITATRNPWGALEQADARLGTKSHIVSPSVFPVTGDRKLTSSASQGSDSGGSEQRLRTAGTADAADDWEEAFN